MRILNSIVVAAFCGALLTGQIAAAKAPTPSAASVISAAEAKAASENKNVFVLFHASWCEWCHKLDDFMARPEIAPLIDANYVTVHIVVEESADKKNLNNPGGDELLESLGGKDQGIPYYAILSPKNETLAVSKDDKGNNIGYPSGDADIPLFMKMLKSTSTRLSDADASLIDTKLQEAGKKITEENEQYRKMYAPIEDAVKAHDYKTVVSGCDEIIASSPDKAAYAYYLRYSALLHVDETKALAEFGRPMGVSKRKEADATRAGLIVQESGLSDRAYQMALKIMSAKYAKGPSRWYQDRQMAQAYARVHKMKEAAEFEDKAIDEAKAAKLPQRVIDDLVKTESDWQKSR